MIEIPCDPSIKCKWLSTVVEKFSGICEETKIFLRHLSQEVSYSIGEGDKDIPLLEDLRMDERAAKALSSGVKTTRRWLASRA